MTTQASIHETTAIVAEQLAVAEEALIWLADADAETIAKVTKVRDELKASFEAHDRERHQHEADRLQALIDSGNDSGLVKLRLKMHRAAAR